MKCDFFLFFIKKILIVSFRFIYLPRVVAIQLLVLKILWGDEILADMPSRLEGEESGINDT